MQVPDAEFDRRLTAHHEAGHAIAALERRGFLLVVTIRARDCALGSCKSDREFPDYATDVDIEPYLVGLYAGRAAADRLAPTHAEYNALGAGSDDEQVLRYMGWVRRRMASPSASVEGAIVCAAPDTRLQYALDGVPSVRCLAYRVSFSLGPAPGLDAAVT